MRLVVRHEVRNPKVVKSPRELVERLLVLAVADEHAVRPLYAVGRVDRWRYGGRRRLLLCGHPLVGGLACAPFVLVLVEKVFFGRLAPGRSFQVDVLPVLDMPQQTELVGALDDEREGSLGRLLSYAHLLKHIAPEVISR